jgi:hypothetical protein
VIAKVEEVAFVVEADEAWKVPGKITCEGSESVTAPVFADAVIWFAVPVREVTKAVEVEIW